MKSAKAVWLGLLCVAGLGISACAADGTLRLPAATSPPYPPPGYTHRAGSSQVDIFYNCSTPEPGMLRLEGVAINPGQSQPVRHLEFELVGVDARGRAVSEARDVVRDYQLFTNESTPFRLDLKKAGSEVRFDLYYEYQFQEGDHNDFISKVAWRGGTLLALQPNRFLVRDACSETSHRAR